MLEKLLTKEKTIVWVIGVVYVWLILLTLAMCLLFREIHENGIRIARQERVMYFQRKGHRRLMKKVEDMEGW